MKSTYILVHGAWQGAWVWREVLDQLRGQGHHAVAIDLPGSGNDATALAEVTLEAYAQAIVKHARPLSSDAITLVGHSMGGAAITAAANLAPDLFARLIYVCAFLPRDGESVTSLAKEGYALGFGGPKAEMILDGLATSLVPESIEATFLNDCSPQIAAMAVPLFRPQAVGPLTTPASRCANAESIQKDYIVCTKDNAIAPELQELMAARGCSRVIGCLESGHEPFLSQPAALAELMLREFEDHYRGPCAPF